MKKITVWLNTHFNCIPLMRGADQSGELSIVTSYPGRKYAEVLLADAFELEPKLNDDEYVLFALDFVQRHNVDVFLPGRRVTALSRHRGQFEALGVKLIVAGDAATLSTLDNKGLFYERLAEKRFLLPEYRVARNAEEFIAAFAALRDNHAIVCFKPTVGIFGYGFRMLECDDNADLLRSRDRSLVVDLPGALQMIGKGGRFEEQIVLEYLPGAERSVDCLAHNGKLLHCVVRRKLTDGSRVLERYPFLEAETARLVAELNLHGIFNVQFKDRCDDEPFLLEINARMSGGIAMSCLWGMVFPYWAVKIALDPSVIDQIPALRTGSLRVTEVTTPVVLSVPQRVA